MPRREEERHLSSTGDHPVYCTCTRCTDEFLRRKGARPGRGLLKRLLGPGRGERVRAHPADCRCATCNLLGSLGGRPIDGPPPAEGGQKKGILQRLLGWK